MTSAGVRLSAASTALLWGGCWSSHVARGVTYICPQQWAFGFMQRELVASARYPASYPQSKGKSGMRGSRREVTGWMPTVDASEIVQEKRVSRTTDVGSGSGEPS